MIILDTDFLVNSIKYKVDITTQIKEKYPKKTISVIDKTLEELKKINNVNSRAAAKLIKLKKFKIIKTIKNKTVDDLILEKAKETDIIATQDKTLKRGLRNKRIETITIRQKKYVGF